MAVIVSSGRVVAVNRTYRAGSPPAYSVALFNARRQTYAQILRTQPNVRTVVDFVARNIAQLGVHLHRRNADNDRTRLTDHPFVAAMAQPNPLDRRMTRYRLTHATVQDLCAFDVSFWAIVNPRNGGRPALLKLPAGRVEIVGESWLWPSGYVLHGNAGRMEIAPENMVHFQGSVDSEDLTAGQPPIETLRLILAEDDAAAIYREQFWRSGARLSGVISRPAGVEWSPTAKDRFAASWSSKYQGLGTDAGGTPILEDGMTYQEVGQSARDAQYIESRKLTREEAAALYHIDPIWVGLNGGSAAYASVVERRRALYEDALGPWIVQYREDLEAQALPAFDTDPDLYVNINTAEKLRGSITDLADSVQKLAGGPIFTRNEARGILDRNAIPEGEGLVTPLNVTVSGGSDPDPVVDSVRGANAADALIDQANHLAGDPPRHFQLGSGRKAHGLTDAQLAALRLEHEAIQESVMVRTFQRQAAAVASQLGATPNAPAAEVFDRTRWDAELFADLIGAAAITAGAFATSTADALGFEDLDLEVLDPYLNANAQISAENINQTTLEALDGALTDPTADEPPPALAAAMFATAISARAAQIAVSRVTALAGFASTDTARQAGRSTKTWIVKSNSPRVSHSLVNGETVDLGDDFSIGGAWPGDPKLPLAERAGCTCVVQFN